jgi:ribosomal protein L9
VQKKIRVILQADLPSGKAYAGEVVQVAPGYARNYLIPKKMALYATYDNFKRLDMKDPDKETPEERLARLARERAMTDDKDAQAADKLQKYFRNKIVSFLFVCLFLHCPLSISYCL